MSLKPNSQHSLGLGRQLLLALVLIVMAATPACVKASPTRYNSNHGAHSREHSLLSAKFMPPAAGSGIYLGAHIWDDPAKGVPATPAEWNQRAEVVRGAVFGIFVAIDAHAALGVASAELVMERAGVVRDAGAAFALKLEPFVGLDAVTDETARRIAQLAAQINNMGVPVLLRFAHEMNGSWYP